MARDRKQIRTFRLSVGVVGLTVSLFFLTATQTFWLGLGLTLGILWALSRRRSIPVIVYHSVSPDASWLPWAGNISVRPEVFARHMQVLEKAGWSVVPDEALFAGRLSPRAKQLCLHFDDAYHDISRHALPVLRDHGFPATIFASSDFIDPSNGVRDTNGTPGYLNANELQAIDREALFKIGCHGKDHALGPVPGPATPRQDQGWDTDAARLWYFMPGDKARWFDGPPPAMNSLPAAESVLIARLETDAGQETDAQRSARVRADLGDARSVLSGLLDRSVDDLCWPFDRVTPKAREDALTVGFTRLTGGREDNPGDHPVDTISRTHVHDHAAGFAPLWVDGLVFRARVEIASGNLLWCPVSWAATLRRRSSPRFQSFMKPT